jgi:molybdenum cofactor biosynthesis enzyme MoaA
VLATLDAAISLLSRSLKSVKINVVLMRGVNDDELTSFAELTRTNPISVRFIEFMPFTGNKWNKDKMIPSSEVLQKLKSVYHGIRAVESPTGIKQCLDATSREHHIPGYSGRIGFISSMSDHFCGTCNRLRITADGQIKVSQVFRKRANFLIHV